MSSNQLFANRTDAGRRLAGKLKHLRGSHPLILGLPRGGIPVAVEVANALDAPLEPMFVKKIGAPGEEELALAAVADGPNPQLVINEEIMSRLPPDSTYIRAQMDQKLEEIRHRRARYLGERPVSDPAGRTVILVDDGIATGSTAKAALAVIRKSNPAWLVLAVPVLPAQSLKDLQSLADELVFLSAPMRFGSVGEHYECFQQVSDAQVIDLLNQHASTGSINETGE